MPFDVSLPVLLALAIGLATCGAAAEAQTVPDADGSEELARAPDPSATDVSAPAPDAVLDATLADEAPAEQAAEAEAEAAARARDAARRAAEAERLARPVVYATGYGLTVTLPGGWEGEVTAQEDRFPGYALYTFANDRPDRAVPGAQLRIERIGALNPLEQQRWLRGQSPYGLHGLRPVAAVDAATLPLAADAALAVEGDGVRGLTAYARRGGTWWAVQATVPETVWRAAPDILAALLGGLELPGESVASPLRRDALPTDR